MSHTAVEVCCRHRKTPSRVATQWARNSCSEQFAISEIHCQASLTLTLRDSVLQPRQCRISSELKYFSWCSFFRRCYEVSVRNIQNAVNRSRGSFIQCPSVCLFCCNFWKHQLTRFIFCTWPNTCLLLIYFHCHHWGSEITLCTNVLHCCLSLANLQYSTGWPKIALAQFLYALTLPNINRFSQLFHC